MDQHWKEVGILFDLNSYWEPFQKDLHEAFDQIRIVSPHLAKHKVASMLKQLFPIQKYTIIDRSIIWYGSIQILGNNKPDVSIMRLQDRELALEIIG